jgi:hypothetical protein
MLELLNQMDGFSSHLNVKVLYSIVYKFFVVAVINLRGVSTNKTIIVLYILLQNKV